MENKQDLGVLSIIILNSHNARKRGIHLLSVSFQRIFMMVKIPFSKDFVKKDISSKLLVKIREHKYRAFKVEVSKFIK